MPPNASRRLGVCVRQTRRDAGMSQAEFARRAATHCNYVGAIERGEIVNPQLATLARFAVALDVSVFGLAASFVRSPAPAAPHRTGAAFDGGGRAVGRALGDLRRSFGVTQHTLAARTGLHRSYIGALERTDDPSRSVGLATLTRFIAGLPHDPPHPDWLALHVGLAAQVFAGEVSAEELGRAPKPRERGEIPPRQSCAQATNPPRIA